MEFISSTSSDSELESKIKLKPFKKEIGSHESTKNINYQLCVFCQKGGKLFESQRISQQKFIECTKVRMNISQSNDPVLSHIFSNLNDLKQQRSVNWHKNCYKSFTSSQNISSYKLKYAKLGTNIRPVDTPQKPNLRTDPFDVQKCIFCQRRLRNKKLCQVMTTNMEQKIKNISRRNPLFYSRIGGNDLIASEIKYHASCVSTELRNTEKKFDKSSTSGKRKLNEENEHLQQLFNEMERRFDKGKGYSTTSVSQRYQEICGKISLDDRTLVKKIQEYFANDIELVTSPRKNEPRMFLKRFSKEQAIDTIAHYTETKSSKISFGTSEIQTLTKICQNIKIEINNIPKNADFKSLHIVHKHP